MDRSNSLLAALVDIHVDPKKALRAADEKSGWTWLPFVLVVVCPILATGYYFGTVDIDWLVDKMLASAGEEVPPEAAQYMTRTTMMVGALVSQAILIPVILAIMGLYLHIVASLSATGRRSYRQWFRLPVWASLPASILGSLAIVINYMASGTHQFTTSQLNFFSANALITHIPTGMPGAALMETVTPFTFWTIGLLTVGVKLWSGRSYGSSLLIVLAPYVVVYGLWGSVSFG